METQASKRDEPARATASTSGSVSHPVPDDHDNDCDGQEEVQDSYFVFCHVPAEVADAIAAQCTQNTPVESPWTFKDFHSSSPVLTNGTEHLYGRFELEAVPQVLVPRKRSRTTRQGERAYGALVQTAVHFSAVKPLNARPDT